MTRLSKACGVPGRPVRKTGPFSHCLMGSSVQISGGQPGPGPERGPSAPPTDRLSTPMALRPLGQCHLIYHQDPSPTQGQAPGCPHLCIPWPSRPEPWQGHALPCAEPSHLEEETNPEATRRASSTGGMSSRCRLRPLFNILIALPPKSSNPEKHSSLLKTKELLHQGDASLSTGDTGS